jgi:hypothetical protein
MRSIIHYRWYHEKHTLSNIIIVLAFSESVSFIRMILQREENKGVELTVHPCNGLETGHRKAALAIEGGKAK